MLLIEDLVYCVEVEEFFHLPTAISYPARALNGLCRPVVDSIPPADWVREHAAVETLAEMRQLHEERKAREQRTIIPNRDQDICYVWANLRSDNQEETSEWPILAWNIIDDGRGRIRVEPIVPFKHLDFGNGATGILNRRTGRVVCATGTDYATLDEFVSRSVE